MSILRRIARWIKNFLRPTVERRKSTTERRARYIRFHPPKFPPFPPAAIIVIATLFLGMKCPIPTPQPPVPPTPVPTATPTAMPTPIVCPDGWLWNGTVCVPIPTPPAPTPVACPCVVVWSGNLYVCQNAAHEVVTKPEVGGSCTIDSTECFERTPGDGRGGPCDTPDRIESTCKNRPCESLGEPAFNYTGPDGPRLTVDGFQLRIGPLVRGSYRVEIDLPFNATDPQGKPVVRCPQYPGNNRPRVVEFSVE